MGHYRRSLDRMMKLASRLSSKNEQGHEVPNPAATTKDLAEYAEAVRECQEARDALRADWVKRKVERIFGVIDIRNLRPLVEESRTLLFPSYFAKRGELR